MYTLDYTHNQRVINGVSYEKTSSRPTHKENYNFI